MNNKLFSRTDILFFLIFLLLLVFVFRVIIFTDSIFFERDSTLLEIPARMLCVKLIKEGNFALWTDAYGDGQPFLANMKHAVLYPSTLLYLIFHFFTAFKLHYLIHFVLGWLGMYYFCKSYTLSQKAAFFGATVFIFSGIVLSSVEFYNHIAALCWMPWILLVLHRYSKKFFLKLIILAFLWALLILAGTPYVIVITLVFCGVQTLLVHFKRKQKIFLLALSLVLALFLSAVQLIPSIKVLNESVRESGSSPIWSLESIQLFNFVFPHILGNDREPGHDDYWGSHLFEKGFPLYYSLYVGFGIFLLFLFGLQKPYDTRHFVFLITLIFFFFLGLGRYSPLYYIWKFIPPFSLIRYSVKYLTGFTFALTMISAIGFDNIFTLKKSNKRKGFSFLAVSVILLTLFFIVKSRLVKILADLFVISKEHSFIELGDSFTRGFLLFTVCSLLIFGYLRFFKGKRIFSWLMLGVVICDLVLVNQFINPVLPVSFVNKPAFMENKEVPLDIHREESMPFAFKDEVGGSSGLHTYFRETLFPYSGLGHNIRYHLSKDFYKLYDREYTAILEYKGYKNMSNRLKVLWAAGGEYYISHHPLPDIPSTEKKIAGYTLYFQKLPERAPPVRLVYDSVKAESFKERMNIFLSDGFNPEKTAIIDRDFEFQNNQRNQDGNRIITLQDFQGYKKYSAEVTQPSLLVVRGNYRSGWKAKIDGEKTDVFKVNLTSKGIFLPPGRHEVLIKYYPESFHLGMIISIVSLLLIICFLVVFLIKRKSI